MYNYCLINNRCAPFFRSSLLALLFCVHFLTVYEAHAETVVAGDLAPRAAPDGILNIADISQLQRIVLGLDTAIGDEVLIGDVAPLNSPDGQLNTADILILMRAMLGEISLQDIVLNPISGGPCLSGAEGATAYRIRFANDGGSAQVIYEVNGLPDTSRDLAGVFGFQIGFTSSFVDPFLGEGGLLLNSSSFVDIELSTLGVSSIHSATLSIYGRSYDTTTSGSFNWQTFSGIGSAPANLVANSVPYGWYSADMLTEIDPDDDSILLRIKSGPSSDSLVVNRIELCLNAD